MKGREIIKAILAERKTDAEAFFGMTRNKRLSKTRKIAIVRLKEAGFTKAAIARLMHRNLSTVYYWLHEDHRNRRVSYSRNYHRQKCGVHRVPSNRYAEESHVH